MPQAKHAYNTPTLPRALPPAARKKIERAAEAHADALAALTAFLDAFDGDPDLEPSLGSMMPLSGVEALDLEGDDDGREHDVDGEPSLGALLNHHHQTGWGNGNKEDLEDSLSHG